MNIVAKVSLFVLVKFFIDINVAESTLKCFRYKSHLHKRPGELMYGNEHSQDKKYFDYALMFKPSHKKEPYFFIFPQFNRKVICYWINSEHKDTEESEKNVHKVDNFGIRDSIYRPELFEKDHSKQNHKGPYSVYPLPHAPYPTFNKFDDSHNVKFHCPLLHCLHRLYFLFNKLSKFAHCPTFVPPIPPHLPYPSHGRPNSYQHLRYPPNFDSFYSNVRSPVHSSSYHTHTGNYPKYLGAGTPFFSSKNRNENGFYPIAVDSHSFDKDHSSSKIFSAFPNTFICKYIRKMDSSSRCPGKYGNNPNIPISYLPNYPPIRNYPNGFKPSPQISNCKNHYENKRCRPIDDSVQGDSLSEEDHGVQSKLCRQPEAVGATYLVKCPNKYNHKYPNDGKPSDSASWKILPHNEQMLPNLRLKNSETPSPLGSVQDQSENLEESELKEDQIGNYDYDLGSIEDEHSGNANGNSKTDHSGEDLDEYEDLHLDEESDDYSEEDDDYETIFDGHEEQEETGNTTNILEENFDGDEDGEGSGDDMIPSGKMKRRKKATSKANKPVRLSKGKWRKKRNNL